VRVMADVSALKDGARPPLAFALPPLSDAEPAPKP
jgi:hypothetical protein